ncbi:TPM domain-containing protein [Haliea sp. E1-2-M8]|uniref:TPM domain-containing protein n=1 Tax=Haliea sp. E1-2-M8 TaxID=3064706 RepID=UPI002720EAE9|nr:TPM domain-containing protein [Haliea sp. E1-2-M8]MDO8862724.1 TPM domain-containing protein [Haliea sp. E1-2-M8]
MVAPLRKSLLLVLLLLLPAAVWAQSAPEFPALTGRVVDRAELLSPEAEAGLTQMLQAHEQASTEQVVVVTLPELQGFPIEDFGYQLGRHWGIGQKGEDNGALLIVARDERKIRIEAGYGVEGRLTDAESSFIINRIMTPAFRKGDFQAGIVNGAAAMIQVLGGEPLAASQGRQGAAQEKPNSGLVGLFFVLMWVVVFFIGGRGGRGGRGGAALMGAALLGATMGGRGGGFGGGGFGGGGFGGGGGSFGGGGASGGW